MVCGFPQKVLPKNAISLLTSSPSSSTSEVAGYVWGLRVTGTILQRVQSLEFERTLIRAPNDLLNNLLGRTISFLPGTMAGSGQFVNERLPS